MTTRGEDNNRLSTLGVRPTAPVIFWDFDKTPFSQIAKWCKKNLDQYDIYQSSKDRYHLVAPADSFDTVQNTLFAIKKAFPHEVYITHCRRLRLRITAKVDALGHEVSPAPVLIECHCRPWHTDKRTGTLEVYFTKW